MVPRSSLRRGLGVVCALTPAAWCLALLVVAVRSIERGSLARLAVGLVVTLLGAAVVALNLHLSIVRPLLHLRRHGSRDGYRHVSGFPFAGTAFGMLGALVGAGSTPLAAIALMAVLLDTGGPAALVIATWRDDSMWA